MSLPNSEPNRRAPRQEIGLLQMLRGAAVWGSIGAVGAGVAWAVGLLIGQTFLGVDISTPPAGTETETAARLARLGVFFGFIVAGFAAALLLRPKAAAILFWSLTMGFATPIGGVLTVIAVVAFKGLLPSEVSASLGFSVTGLLAGLAGYVWFRWKAAIAAPPPEDEDEDEQPGQTPGEGKASMPRPREPGVYGSAVRLLPVPTIAVAALIAAAVLAPSEGTFGFFAVGLLGFAATVTLWDQERRLCDLERRHRRREP